MKHEKGKYYARTTQNGKTNYHSSTVILCTLTTESGIDFPGVCVTTKSDMISVGQYSTNWDFNSYEIEVDTDLKLQ